MADNAQDSSLAPGKVVGLVGGARAGKSSLAMRMAAHLGYYRLAIADPMKDLAHTMLSSSGVQVPPTKTGRIEFADGSSTDLREIYQRFGDFLRGSMGRDVLLRILDRRIQSLRARGYRYLVIEDIRLRAEAEHIRNRYEALLLKVLAETGTVAAEAIGGVAGHMTESQWQAIRPDRVGTPHQLMAMLYERELHAAGPVLDTA